MKKFRNDNDEDDFEDTEVKATSAKQPEKDNRRLIKIILNIILIIAIIKVGLGVFERYYFNEFYYKAPNLTGLSIEEAKKTISKSPLNIREMGEVYSDLPYGTVALQEPAEGTIVKRSRNMKVWVSKESPSVFLDDLVGMNYIEATSPKSGEPISRGQKFDFLISNGLE